MQDAHLRQRNIVFPDTVRNEARFWRNIATHHLTPVQVIGVAVMGLAMLLPLWFIIKCLASSPIYWLVLTLYGILFLLLRWRVRKALGDVERQRQAKP
jgi:hypothetical protein